MKPKSNQHGTKMSHPLSSLNPHSTHIRHEYKQTYNQHVTKTQRKCYTQSSKCNKKCKFGLPSSYSKYHIVVYECIHKFNMNALILLGHASGCHAKSSLCQPSPTNHSFGQPVAGPLLSSVTTLKAIVLDLDLQRTHHLRWICPYLFFLESSGPEYRLLHIRDCTNHLFHLDGAG